MAQTASRTTANATPGTATAALGNQAQLTVTIAPAEPSLARAFSARLSSRAAIALAGGSDARY